MAIRKQAKNMYITVTADYNLTVDKKIQKIAEKINVEALSDNLVLACNKKIVSDGNK